MLLTLLIAFSAAFVITHLALSHGNLRAGLVKQLGPMRFRGLYSFVSLGTFLPAAVIEWREPHLGPVLWELAHWLELAVALPLMLAAIVLLVLAFAQPSPVSMIPSRPEARGVLRITRHPMNMGFALFGLAHLAANGALGDVAFFGMFVLVGLVGAYHQDARIARERGEVMAEFRHTTSVLPFGAILRGQGKLDLGELPWPMIAVAVIVWGTLLWFHGRLIGGDVLPW